MAATPRIGTEFAAYRIEALLGRGGMSVVYRAENPRLGNQVALKLLAPELTEDESFRERFVRESRAAASIVHPNIIPIYDAGDWEGVLYIAMRYVDGPNLRELAKRADGLLPGRALRLASQIGSALDAAHARGLIHRDVKPANVLVEETAEAEDHAYLADFGLTKHLESHSGITGTGQFVGTIDYMAPEQIEGRAVDARADLYALACVAFECLAGVPPYRRDTEVAVLWAHMRDDPPVLSEARPGLPEAADAVVARALAKDPAERYESCREFVGELRAALGDAPHTALTTALPRATDSPHGATAVRPQRGRPSRTGLRANALGSLGVLLLGLLLGAGIASAILLPSRTSSRKLVTQQKTTTVQNDFLRALIPPAIRSTCSRGKLRTNYYVSYFCKPGNGADHVTYNLAIGRAQMLNQFFLRAHAEGVGISGGAFQPSGDCSVGEKAIQRWAVRAGAGHTALTAASGSGAAKGDVLCHSEGGRSWIEWTDDRLNVYATANGPDGQRLYDWWSRLAGPRPA
jgi:serine/threonine-protein kinase